MEQSLYQIQIHLYNCAKINNDNNAPYIAFTEANALQLKATTKTMCREPCFTIGHLNIPQWLDKQLINTSGVFTIRENIEFLKNCTINNNTVLKTGFSDFLIPK
jgi:hypothetical protein